MKKSIVLLSAGCVAACLMAFGFINWNEQSLVKTESGQCGSTAPPQCQAAPSCMTADNNGSEILETMLVMKEKVYSDFVYNMGPRFEPVTKKQLRNASSISDFLTKEEVNRILKLETVNLTVIENGRQTDIREIGTTENLTKAQRAIIQDVDYGFKFTLRSEFLERDKETGKLKDSFFGPHFIVVPETQASYIPGDHRMIEYLRYNNKEYTADLDESKLQPAMLYFTVTKDGGLAQVHLDRTTGNSALDNSMVNLLMASPGQWEPARNAAGEKVDQELTVSFGLANGC